MPSWRKVLGQRTLRTSGTVPASDEHRVHEFRGTPFEVGKQHGRALSREIRAESKPFLKWVASKHGLRVSASAQLLVSRYEGLFRERMPAVLEEIQGIAEGARIAYRYAFVAAVRDMMDAGGCTSVALSGAGHPAGPVIGQTRDTSGSSSRFHIMRIQYDSGRSMVLLNYPGWIANTGITSDGLAFAGFSLFAAAPDKPTVPGSFRKRLVLEARSTAEVLDQISGLSFPNGGLLIGDRSGHMACVEMVAGRVAVRDVSGMALGHSNSICITEMKQFEAIIPDASSDLRRVNIERILSEQGGNISIKSLKAAFRDHTGFPLSICRHNSPTDTWITSAAFVADLKALEIHIAIGSPCTSPFVRYTATA